MKKKTKQIWPSTVVATKEKGSTVQTLSIPLLLIGVGLVAANLYLQGYSVKQSGRLTLTRNATSVSAGSGHNITIANSTISNSNQTTTTLSLRDLLLPQTDQKSVRSWESQAERRPLNFVHIPKTGGSSVVQAAIDAGLNWGDCLFPQHPHGWKCPRPVNGSWPNPDPELGRTWWHTPIQYLPFHQYGNGINPYQDQDLFAMIRNPYDRAVSEFFYRCKMGGCRRIWQNPTTAVRLLNQRIQNMLTAIQSATPGTSREYYFHWGHWIPQHHFFYSNNNNHSQPMIQHLLHTEYLQEDFASLMMAYQLNLTLPRQKFNNRKDVMIAGTYSLGVQNLTLSSLQLIEQVYKEDFDLGGYRRISSILYPQTGHNRTMSMTPGR